MRRLVVGAALAASSAFAQMSGEDLDTPFVITPTNVVTAMLDLAQIHGGERLIDLGSGDGRIVLAAAQRGAIGTGIEIDANLVEKSRAAARRLKLEDRATFLTQDLFDTDFSSADVVTLYLLPDVNRRLAPKFLATLRPGTRIVSHDYGLGAWPPDATIVVDAPDKPVNVEKKSRVHYWVVPANVAGAWRGEANGMPVTLRMEQAYQHVSGTLSWAGRDYRFEDRKVHGDRLALAFASAPGPLDVELRARGNVMSGEVRAAGRPPVAISVSR